MLQSTGSQRVRRNWATKQQSNFPFLSTLLGFLGLTSSLLWSTQSAAVPSWPLFYCSEAINLFSSRTQIYIPRLQAHWSTEHPVASANRLQGQGEGDTPLPQVPQDWSMWWPGPEPWSNPQNVIRTRQNSCTLWTQKPQAWGKHVHPEPASLVSQLGALLCSSSLSPSPRGLFPVLWISESSISAAELTPLEENNWGLTEMVEMQKNVKGQPWTHMKAGRSPWNPEQARVVTEGEITRVPRGLGGSRKITQSRWLLGE